MVVYRLARPNSSRTLEIWSPSSSVCVTNAVKKSYLALFLCCDLSADGTTELLVMKPTTPASRIKALGSKRRWLI